jgi:hypothetical protein
VSDQTQETSDALRHRNLQHIGRSIQLPPAADADRRQRWQQAAAVPARSTALPVNRPRRLRAAWFGCSALAAAVALAVWLGLGHVPPVTAAEILEKLASAVARSLTIRLAGIDLQTVQISGELALDRAPGSAAQRRYAEVHVLMKADNPQWNDIDGVLVIHDAPEASWIFCRGNGGSTGWWGTQVTATEYLVEGAGWSDFAEQPLNQFDAMPLQLSFSSGGSSVTYRLSRQRRAFVEGLLKFLLRLSDPATADETVARLQTAAGQAELERRGAGMYIMRLSQFGPLDILEIPASGLDRARELLGEVVWTIQYDPIAKVFRGGATSDPPGFSGTGIEYSIGEAGVHRQPAPIDGPVDRV